MFSDTLVEAIEKIWEGVRYYDYSLDHKEADIDAITELQYIVYQLDNCCNEMLWSKDKIKKHVMKRWDEEWGDDE
jgi:hypothetical protein